MTGLRERKKEKTRRDLAEAALTLFRDKGYEATTVDDIAEVVGVSSRTFFRYYDSKEAVLFGSWREDITALEEFLVERPADEPLLTSVKALSQVIAANVEADIEHQLFIKKIVAENPSAGSYETHVLMPAYRESFVRAVHQRAGDSAEGDMAPGLASAVAVAALHEAKLQWMENTELSLAALTEKAYDTLAAMFSEG